MEWQGPEDHCRGAILAVLEKDDDDRAVALGPIEVDIHADGMATVAFTERYGDSDWKIYYWVGGNGNGTCDQDDWADVKQRTSVASDLEAIGLS